VTTVDVRRIDGSVAGTVELDEAIFGIQPNVPVMHQVVTAQLAAGRAGTHSTKTRAEVAGGGKKPYRQKGTGRARQGSTRAPHWTGGGVALGPKPRSYRQRTPRKMIQLALRSALSDRAAENRVAVVDEWPWTAPKTADAKAALTALGFDEGKALIVMDLETDDVAFRCFRNIPDVQLILIGELNAYDVLCNDWIVFSRATLPGGSGGSGGAEPAAKAPPAAGDAPAKRTAEAAPEAGAPGPAAAPPPVALGSADSPSEAESPEAEEGEEQ
jgi:large subunit ribosomal protein L4